MKPKMYRLLLLMTLFMGSLNATKANAQWVVSDPTNFFGNLVNSGAQIAQALEQFGIATKQFEQVEKMYNKISPYIRTFGKGYEAMTALNEIRMLGSTVVNAHKGDQYLTTAERIYIIRMQTYYINQAVKELNNITGLSSMVRGGGSSDVKISTGSDAERLKLIDESFEKIIACGHAIRSTSYKMNALSYGRRQQDMSHQMLRKLRGF